MPTFDSAWDDLTAISQLTTTRWNDVTNDLQAFLVGLDDDFFVATVLDPDKIDGVAVTLGDLAGGPSAQVITRETRFSGITVPLLFNNLKRWTRQTAADADDTITVDTDIFAYTSLTASRTVTLPPAATAGDGFRVWIVDESGSAASFNIVIDGDGAETIDGAATALISANYGQLGVYSDGSNWFTFTA